MTENNDLIKAWRAIGPVKWSEGPYGWIMETGEPVKLISWQRAILTEYWKHRHEVSTLAISNVKKTGKTFTNAILTGWRWLALPGQHFCIGNDLDQSAARQFAMIAEMVQRNPYLRDNVKAGVKVLTFLPTGSTLEALASDAAGNAGSNHLTASHTESWGIIYPAGIRAYEEMTPPPGKWWGLPALRILDSYAGFEGESITWHGIVDRGLTGERINKEWPIFKVGGLILFHMTGEEARARCFRGSPAEAAEYYTEQASALRPNTFARMHGNDRTSGESQFLPPGAWEACFSPDLLPITAGDTTRLVLGADASTSRDLTALVGVQPGKVLEVKHIRIWSPVKGSLRNGRPTVDLEASIGAEVERLYSANQIAAIVADPFQLHTLIIRWQKMGIRVIELAQSAGRVESDQALYDLIVSKGIRHYGDPTLTQHIKNAVAIETPRGIRLAKEKTSLKIDGCVALSMAAYGAQGTSQPLPIPKEQPEQESKWIKFGSEHPAFGNDLVGWANRY